MIVYWKLSYEWLKTMGSRMSKGNRAMLCLGVIACLGLIFYTTVLGSIGEIYRLQRRIGITLFYTSTFLAQLIMTGQIAFALKARPSLISTGTYRSLLAICIRVLGSFAHAAQSAAASRVPRIARSPDLVIMGVSLF